METLTFFIMMGFAAAVMAWYILNHENGGNGTMGFIGIIVDKIDEKLDTVKNYRAKERKGPAKRNLKSRFKERKPLKGSDSEKDLNPHAVRKVKLNYDEERHKGRHHRAGRVKEKLTNINEVKAEARRHKTEQRKAKKASTLTFKENLALKAEVVVAHADDIMMTQTPANDVGSDEQLIKRKSYKRTTRNRFKTKATSLQKNGIGRVKPRDKLAKIGDEKVGNGNSDFSRIGPR